MDPSSVTIAQKAVLLVEGKDDCHFFEALKEHLGLSALQVMPYRSSGEFRPVLRAIVNAPGFREVRALGIVREADQDASGAFRAVCDALGTVNLVVPDRPMVVHMPDTDGPAVGIAIIPDGRPSGVLEDMCLASVSTQPAMECISGYFECLREKGTIVASQESKSRALVYLASRQASRGELKFSIGVAARAGYWDWDHACFLSLKSFLHGVQDVAR